MPFDPLLPRPLTNRSIRTFAPAASGIYGITNAREWLYIGESDNIQGSILALLAETDTALMNQTPTGFVFELCEQARRPARQDRLVSEYEPSCNAQKYERS
jgi:hypothetical protein